MESLFLLVLSMLAMQIILESLENEPVFLCIDDTMIAKFGHKFENVSKLFFMLIVVGNESLEYALP